MKPNIIKLLIFFNVSIFIISLIIIYSRYTSVVNFSKTTSNKDVRQFSSKEEMVIQDDKKTLTVENNQQPSEFKATTLPELKLRKPKFTYFSSKAKKVELIGDFNEWIPQPMKKVAPNRWELAIEIPEGRYLYNFLVDDKPILDPNNKKPPELS
ncbi:MAG: glycogen-binding domain-containing protein [Endomicrobia bacterium]|nr:glycogen-binding domain-containing protein [Endomicrobiia bacterium]